MINLSNAEVVPAKQGYLRRHKIGLSVVAVLTVLLLVVGHAFGLILALPIWFVYFGVQLGFGIFRKGTRYVASTNAEALAEKLRDTPHDH